MCGTSAERASDDIFIAFITHLLVQPESSTEHRFESCQTEAVMVLISHAFDKTLNAGFSVEKLVNRKLSDALSCFRTMGYGTLSSHEY